MSQSVITGFFAGLSLILAIGAQNTFVLRQGLRREHVLWVCLVCACSDAVLIAAGVLGLGAVVKAVPMLETVTRFGGAAFLLAYGLGNLRRAWKAPQGMAAQNMDGDARPLRPVLATCLALTWLNPHVYLDTVVLLGSVAADARAPLWFGAGAIAASFAFFFALGFGARLLAPAFAKPKTWRILDGCVGLTMIGLASVLAFGS